MGAEPWGNIVPYQSDIEKALRELQQAVFTRGEYRRPGIEVGLDDLDGLDFFGRSTQEQEEILTKYGFTALREPLRRVGAGAFRQWLIDLSAAPRIDTIEELRILQCLDGDGTASALDMNSIADEPEIGCVTLLPASALVDMYGTDRPTREMVEENQEFYENIGRGEGIYFIVYKHGEPDEIFFGGYSVD